MTTIKDLRNKIDKIDASIIKKLAMRQKLSQRMGKLKAKTGKKVLDIKREKQLDRFYQALSIKYQLPTSYVQRLFHIIIHYSRQVQKKAG